MPSPPAAHAPAPPLVPSAVCAAMQTGDTAGVQPWAETASPEAVHEAEVYWVRHTLRYLDILAVLEANDRSDTGRFHHWCKTGDTDSLHQLLDQPERVDPETVWAGFKTAHGNTHGAVLEILWPHLGPQWQTEGAQLLWTQAKNYGVDFCWRATMTLDEAERGDLAIHGLIQTAKIKDSLPTLRVMMAEAQRLRAPALTDNFTAILDAAFQARDPQSMRWLVDDIEVDPQPLFASLNEGNFGSMGFMMADTFASMLSAEWTHRLLSTVTMPERFWSSYPRYRALERELKAQRDLVKEAAADPHRVRSRLRT